ncbi:MAG: hypothetical protein V1790_15005 [Planctomycetota bacterium]
MMTVSARGTRHKNRFDVVAEAFRRKEGLPFADVLSAESIQRVFREENALFGQEDLFSTDIVLWAFLAQTLRDGKGAACAAAVSGFHCAVTRLWRKWLGRRKRAAPIPWPLFQRLSERYPPPRPVIVHSMYRGVANP